jgi:dihydrofolate synthase / folylpolyglutamate synthase
MIKNYKQAIDFLKTTVPDNKHKYPGGLGLERQAEILRLLGNPQNKIPAIHIAGTSGKGSTSFYISSLLISHGFKVGLTISPHLIDIRERFQINNTLIPKKDFIKYFNQILPIVESVDYKKFGRPTFFEILIALAFYIFYQQKVDYMVVETALGGLLDGTNTITTSNQICVLTKFGLDHTSVLGKNITSIATQKAGIIHPHNPVFSVHQIKVAREVLSKQANINYTNINYISPNKNFKNIKSKNGLLQYDFSFDNLVLKDLKLNSLALFQVENSAITISVVKHLSVRDKFNLSPDKIRQTLASVFFPGRMEILTLRGQKLILDGAHNPQKMMAFVKSLKKSFPNQKFVFLLAFKQRKDFSKMIRMLVPLASEIIITKFFVTTQDMIQKSQSSKDIIRIFNKLNFSDFQYIPDKSKAFDYVLKTKQPMVVTGSLYLIGEIYPLLDSLK